MLVPIFDGFARDLKDLSVDQFDKIGPERWARVTPNESISLLSRVTEHFGVDLSEVLAIAASAMLRLSSEARPPRWLASMLSPSELQNIWDTETWSSSYTRLAPLLPNLNLLSPRQARAGAIWLGRVARALRQARIPIMTPLGLFAAIAPLLIAGLRIPADQESRLPTAAAELNADVRTCLLYCQLFQCGDLAPILGVLTRSDGKELGAAVMLRLFEFVNQAIAHTKVTKSLFLKVTQPPVSFKKYFGQNWHEVAVKWAADFLGSATCAGVTNSQMALTPVARLYVLEPETVIQNWDTAVASFRNFPGDDRAFLEANVEAEIVRLGSAYPPQSSGTPPGPCLDGQRTVASAKAVVPQCGAGELAGIALTLPPEANVLASPSDIARQYGIPLHSLQKRLERRRKKHAEGWSEVIFDAVPGRTPRHRVYGPRGAAQTLRR